MNLILSLFQKYFTIEIVSFAFEVMDIRGEKLHSAPPVEFAFQREENKFFIPQSSASTVVDRMVTLCAQNGFTKEQFLHPITRSVYYFNGDSNNLPPGMSIRYREYVDAAVKDGGMLGGSDTGFLELKWWDENGQPTPIKRKARIPSKFFSEHTLSSIMDEVHASGEAGTIDQETIKSLERHSKILAGIDPQMKLQPLFFVEYQRNRFTKPMGNHKKNVISVDKNIDVYTTERMHEGRPIAHLGGIQGAVVEYKESVEDEKTQWQLVKVLAPGNAVRFYGKKGEALNLLQRHRSKDAPPIKNELPAYELEAKMDVLADIPHASQFVSKLYDHFDQSDDHFTITPGFRYLNSQSTMATYVHDPTDAKREGKILIGLEAKYSSKQVVDQDPSFGFFVRSEEKGERFEYERTKARELLEGMHISGKTQRIRRAFYISSKETNRIYKVSVDFNWKLPVQDNDFFSQVEVEYTGIPIGQHKIVSIDSKEAGLIKEDIKQLMTSVSHVADENHIDHRIGGRKVDTVAS